ncbi:MAG: sulfotransferase [Alphaproteobacteria bacterium]|nr:sulfotransferase [Alphaproteobacteria bacterium]
MTSQAPREGYVFVVTYGRSGSTLLQTVLQSIDGYFFRGENNNAILPLFHSFQRVRGALEEHGYKAIASHGPWYGADEFNPDRYAAKLMQVFLEEVIQAPDDARVVGFKEIRFNESGPKEFVELLDFMAEQFVPAKFIFNMRQWQDVAKSGWWRDCDPEKVRKEIEKNDRQFKAYAEENPDRSFLLQYEDYVGQPEKLAPLFEFLGEPFDPERIAEVTGRRLKH